MTTLTVEIDKEKDLPALKALFKRLGLNFKVLDNEWGNLNDKEIEGIKSGILDIEEGRILTYEDVMKGINLKLDNFKNNGR
ncbi:hypothetical protein A5893_08935 [Pedobacter psychrophilus]|uniref:Uncharacterized protein n=1 Tax=Pedobacter psychrophilus TaxID=1826909 RepID=A0A179DFF6_9SPHI|nr:hypothetical protein [Pedobacter psychrophilus]OAQ39698.1 hypothetical protein A5893_08935 [Pedobacter psychrophilus]